MAVKQRCPSCNTYSLKCTKTIPVELGTHELECVRVSYWKCSKCNAYYHLHIPMGKLTKVKSPN